MTPEQVRRIIREELASLLKSDRYLFEKHIQMADGRNIQTGLTTGTKIGTAATQKLGFYGVTPIVQPVAISAPTGAGSAGVDQPARDAINVIILRLQDLGLTA